MNFHAFVNTHSFHYQKKTTNKMKEKGKEWMWRAWNSVEVERESVYFYKLYTFRLPLTFLWGCSYIFVVCRISL